LGINPTLSLFHLRSRAAHCSSAPQPIDRLTKFARRKDAQRMYGLRNSPSPNWDGDMWLGQMEFVLSPMLHV